LREPNIGKHFALPKAGSAAKPCVLSFIRFLEVLRELNISN